MGIVTTPIEPTAELEHQCRSILQRWQSGEMPYNAALQSLKVLQKEITVAENFANQGRIEFVIGYIQVHRGKYQSSIEHFQNSRQLFEKANNWVRMTRCDLNLGEAYRLLGDFNKARQFFRRVYEISSEQGEIKTSVFAIANEGQVLLSMDKRDEALEALLAAKQIAEEIPMDEFNSMAGLLCEVNYGLSMIYLHQEQYDLAWEAAKRSYNAAKDAQQLPYLGQANRTMGEALTALGIIPQEGELVPDPDIYFEAALKAFEELDAQGELGRTLYSHAMSLAKRGKRVPAARKLQKAMLIFSELGMTDDAAKAAEAQNYIF